MEELTASTIGETLKKSPRVVLHFWADWAPQCAEMDAVLNDMAKSQPGIKFARIEPEAHPEVAEAHAIVAVPTIIFFINGAVSDRLDGANAAALTAKVKAFGGSAPPPQALGKAAATPVASKDALNARLKALINAAPTMLFMKGTADEPRCGFSRKIVEALKGADIKFSTFDILSDEAVRQGLKEYSDWPTFPQLYVSGSLVGGLDIVNEMLSSGELQDLLPKPEDLNARLKALINTQDVMAFIKGTPETPRCGFSKTLIGIFNETGVKYGYYDILGDDEVRQGLKTYSDWPTYPQVYVKGELIGGLDIIKELQEGGDLVQTLMV